MTTTKNEVLENLFRKKWESFLNFEKKEYVFQDLYYVMKTNQIAIRTNDGFIKLNCGQYKKEFENLIAAVPPGNVID